MTRTVLHTALSAVAALTLAASCLSTPSFAADVKTFQFVAPKAGRDVAAPVTAQFLPPKTGRVETASGSGGGSATTLFRLTPKAPPAGSNFGSGSTTAQFVAPKAKKTGSDGAITAKFVAPKAKKVETQVFASADKPSKPLLLAPATTSAVVEVDQSAPAPEAVAEAAPEAPVAQDTGRLEASSREIALAYLRAAQRYGYGAYVESAYDDEDYDNEDNSDEGYGEEPCQ